MLTHCPECGHENSEIAVACVESGRPIPTAPPVMERRVVVTHPEDTGVPTWAFVAMGVVAIGLITILFFVLKSPADQANTNINVNATTAKQNTVTEPARTTTLPSTETQPASIEFQAVSKDLAKAICFVIWAIVVQIAILILVVECLPETCASGVAHNNEGRIQDRIRREEFKQNHYRLKLSVWGRGKG